MLLRPAQEKKNRPDNSLSLEDFKNSSRLQFRTKELVNFICKAGSMYTGMQHLQIMEGVEILRSCSENLVVDVAILSAGYGLISEDKEIAPYSVTFNDMKAKDLDEWAKFLNIHSAFESKIAADDLIFVLLGEKYLRSLSLPVLSHDRQTLIFLASYSSQKYIKEISAQTFVLPLNNAEAKQYS